MASYDQRDLRLTVGFLKAGKPVILPTDTVPGLCASAAVPQAPRVLAWLKRRPPEKKIAMLALTPEQIFPYAVWNEHAERCYASLPPGRFTLLLRARHGGGTAGVRFPDHAFCRAVLRLNGAPLFATSANLSGMAEPASPSEARAWFPQVYAANGDGLPGCGRASAVIDVRAMPFRILREGALTPEQLAGAQAWSYPATSENLPLISSI